MQDQRSTPPLVLPALRIGLPSGGRARGFRRFDPAACTVLPAKYGARQTLDEQGCSRAIAEEITAYISASVAHPLTNQVAPAKAAQYYFPSFLPNGTREQILPARPPIHFPFTRIAMRRVSTLSIIVAPLCVAACQGPIVVPPNDATPPATLFLTASGPDGLSLNTADQNSPQEADVAADARITVTATARDEESGIRELALQIRPVTYSGSGSDGVMSRGETETLAVTRNAPAGPGGSTPAGAQVTGTIDIARLLGGAQRINVRVQAMAVNQLQDTAFSPPLEFRVP